MISNHIQCPLRSHNFYCQECGDLGVPLIGSECRWCRMDRLDPSGEDEAEEEEPTEEEK